MMAPLICFALIFPVQTFVSCFLLTVEVGKSLLSKKIPQKQQILSYNSVNEAVDSAVDEVRRLERYERNLDAAVIYPKPGSVFFAQLLDTWPTVEATQYQKDSVVATKAASYLLYKYCSASYLRRDNRCVDQLKLINTNGTELHEKYLRMYSVTECNPVQKYRTIDGSCNNLQKPFLGRSNTVYGRLLEADYDDGLSLMRDSLNNNFPKPRTISTVLSNNDNGAASLEQKPMAVVFWALLIYHDMSFTPVSSMIHLKKPVICCSLNGNHLSPRHIHPSCAPISVSKSDPFFGPKYQTCMNYVRSLPGLRTHGKLGPVDQMNQATHFLDASFLYGSTDSYARSIRTMRDGKLKDFYQLLSKCYKSAGSSVCYDNGNARITFLPQIEAIYKMFFLEHNRIAEILGSINKNWDDEIIYQETRRIIVAVVQHITYNHWLPTVLGHKFANKTLTEGREQLGDYNSDVEPLVDNEIASVAFPAFYSMLDGTINVYNEDGKLLKETLLREHIIRNYTDDDYVKQLIKHVITQPARKLDTKYAETLTKYWYSTSEESGLDLFSLDIQRSRDHGLPGYSKYRKFCNSQEVKTFEDLKNIMDNEDVVKLKTLYQKTDDIDLLIGVISEKHEHNGLIGETLRCLITSQFERTRFGDRYFFEREDNFNSAQLSQIKKYSLGRIFCNNGGIIKVQPDVFTAADNQKNKLFNCEDVKPIKLDAWKVI